MIKYSGFEYLLIDIANQFGLDKLLFEERIQWAKDNLDKLESLADKADKVPLYSKAVIALRKAQAGLPTGHLVGFDAVCSGIQVMSVLTGCIKGAEATGMVNPNVRADAYTSVTKAMEKLLDSKLSVSRADAKQALMTSFYGSKAVPIRLFGKDTPELDAFYTAATNTAPGAWELLQDLLASWQSDALSHEWKLPDGFDSKVKVMQKVETRIEVDELLHATMSYEYYVNAGAKKGLSNVANVVHSFDAYVLRCIHRRCNYDRNAIESAANLIEMELIQRSMGIDTEGFDASDKVVYYIDQYRRSSVADAVILPLLTPEDMSSLDTKHLQTLATIANGMLEYQPFEVITIHDEFKCHPNNMNHLRQQYINIMAELADSEVLSDVLGQLLGTSITYVKQSTTLGNDIRQSNYALS